MRLGTLLRPLSTYLPHHSVHCLLQACHASQSASEYCQLLLSLQCFAQMSVFFLPIFSIILRIKLLIICELYHIFMN